MKKNKNTIRTKNKKKFRANRNLKLHSRKQTASSYRLKNLQRIMERF